MLLHKCKKSFPHLPMFQIFMCKVQLLKLFLFTRFILFYIHSISNFPKMTHILIVKCIFVNCILYYCLHCFYVVILLSSMFIVYFVFRHLPNVVLLINRLIVYMYSCSSSIAPKQLSSYLIDFLNIIAITQRWFLTQHHDNG